MRSVSETRGCVVNGTMMEAALRWWLQVREAPADVAVQRAFDAWLAAEDAHRLAYLEILMTANAAAEATMPRAIPPRARSRSPVAWLGAAFAGLLIFGLLIGPRWSEQWRADLVSAPGGGNARVLADGTRLELGADSAVAFDFGAGTRNIELLRGMVTVEVAADPRPLTLRWRDVAVRDIGTRFTVQAAADTVRIGVAEGRVDVRRGDASPVPVRAGEAIDWSDPTPQRGAWREPVPTPGLLVLDRAPAALALAQWAASRGTRVYWLGPAPTGALLDAALPVRTPEEQRAALKTLARHYRLDIVLDGAGLLVLRPSH